MSEIESELKTIFPQASFLHEMSIFYAYPPKLCQKHGVTELISKENPSARLIIFPKDKKRETKILFQDEIIVRPTSLEFRSDSAFSDYLIYQLPLKVFNFKNLIESDANKEASGQFYFEAQEHIENFLKNNIQIKQRLEEIFDDPQLAFALSPNENTIYLLY